MTNMPLNPYSQMTHDKAAISQGMNKVFPSSRRTSIVVCMAGGLDYSLQSTLTDKLFRQKGCCTFCQAPWGEGWGGGLKQENLHTESTVFWKLTNWTLYEKKNVMLKHSRPGCPYSIFNVITIITICIAPSLVIISSYCGHTYP